jgi:hypothetical protein
MTIDWLPLIHPLELYAVLALVGVCLLYIFILHMNWRRLASHSHQQREALEARLNQLAESAERLRSELEEATRPSAGPVRQSVNLNKRGQVLRMRRRGENPETISAALGIPRNEVDLLLKVHQLAAERVQEAAG